MWRRFRLDGKWSWNIWRKLPGKNTILILLLVGVLLLVIVFPTGGGAETKLTEETTVTDDEGGNNLVAYERRMEQRLQEALENVDGVGKTTVMLTLGSTSQKVVEKDTQTDIQNASEEDSQGGTRTTEDKSTNKTSVYTQDESGTQVPYVSKELTPQVEGVIVIAEGGDNPVVIQNITEAVQALFGVEAHKIKIMKQGDS